MVIGLFGCGDHNNWFGSLADKNSSAAKIQEAQTALDKGDCQTAINGFTEAFNKDPNDVGIRVNLAAAYSCRAGFNPTALISAASDYASSNKDAAQFGLFKLVADNAARLVVPCQDGNGAPISPCWDTDTKKAESLLSETNPDTASTCSLLPIGLSQDAAFNLTVVETIRAVMAVMDLTKYVADLGTVTVDINSITSEALNFIQTIMGTADQTLSCTNTFFPNQPVVSDDVKKTLHDLNVGLNDVNCAPGASATDACHTDSLTTSDVTAFLTQQGITIPAIP
jgi:hypothetical protein